MTIIVDAGNVLVQYQCMDLPKLAFDNWCAGRPYNATMLNIYLVRNSL